MRTIGLSQLKKKLSPNASSSNSLSTSTTTKNKKRPLSKLTFHQLDWLEWTTIGIGLWFIFYPKPYMLLFSVLLFIPILGLILNGLSGKPSIASLVEITKKNNGEDAYDVADFIDFAAIAILIRVVKDFEFEDFFSLIIPGTITFVVMLILLFTTHKLIEEGKKNVTWIYASLLFNIFLYSYAATYGVNCVYDTSKAKVYTAKVLDKRISSGKHKTYYLKVTPWGHHHDVEELSVSPSQYRETEVGETITIDLKEGLLKIPWYYVE